MIKELRVSGFKAFEQFSVSFRRDGLLVGPNNAGKSTLIGALRAGAAMLRIAKQRSPDQSREDGGTSFLAYQFSGERVALVEENLRHEFREQEVRLKLRMNNSGTLVAVWPPPLNLDSREDSEETDSPFFYLDVSDKPQPRRPLEVRRMFSTIGVIPCLSPVERHEHVMSKDYVKENFEARLTSRHFRNGLYLLQQNEELEEFLEFSRRWIPEIDDLELEIRPGLEAHEIDVYFREKGSRTQKEICWAGDGIQVWMQLLLHLFRLRGVATIVLDEPDLYLHPDLQRRLTALLESLDAQTIMASHSAEIVGEAAPENVLWVDKSRKFAVRAPKDEALTSLSGAIGSQFNLRLAKALRSNVVLFVEGGDMKIISTLAKTIGAERLSTEQGIAVIPLQGFSNWEHLEPFSWLIDRFLGTAVKTFVIVDRDYRGESACKRFVKDMETLKIHGHVWGRKELESYLLEDTALARVAKLELSQTRRVLSKAIKSLKGKVFARALDQAIQERVDVDHHRVSVTEEFQNEFDETWADPQRRLHLSPPKEVFRLANRQIQELGGVTLNFRSVAKALRPEEIDSEVLTLLQAIEDSLHS